MPVSPLCRLGHVATVAELRSAGVPDPASLGAAAYRPRTGLLACAHLSPEERAAVFCRARLDGVTVLRELGIWCGRARGLQLRLHRGDRHGTARLARLDRRVTVRWRAERFGGGDRLRVSVPDALLAVMSELPADDVVAAIESAVHLRAITRQHALEVIAAAPRRLQRQLAEVDTEFRAQSGWETHMRLRLTRRGHRVEPQARVPGVGHLDNLVDGVLAVETDGRQHADSLDEDHRRDLGTEAWGIRVLRLDPRLIERDWPAVLEVIERMIEDAR